MYDRLCIVTARGDRRIVTIYGDGAWTDYGYDESFVRVIKDGTVFAMYKTETVLEVKLLKYDEKLPASYEVLHTEFYK